MPQPPGHLGKRGRQPDRREVAPEPPRVLPRAEPEPDREAEGEAQPDRHRLAMDEPGGVVAGHPLERVREGVAEVEQRPLAVLALVADDDRGLRPAALGDGVVALRAAGEDRGASSPRTIRRSARRR